MKYTILFLWLILPFSLHAQVSIDDLLFETDYIDLGDLDELGGNVQATFKYKNNSEYFFIITDIDVSCGCTAPNRYQKRVNPGDSGSITVTFNPKGQLGNITKWIHVKANFKDAHYKELRFKAHVTRKQIDHIDQDYYPGQYGYLLLMNPYLRYGRQFQGFQGIDSVSVTNDGEQSYEVTEVTGLPSYIKAVNLPLKVEAKNVGFIRFEIDLSQIDTIGLLGGEFKLITNDQFFKTKSVNYSIEVQQDFSKLSRRAIKKAPVMELDRRVIEMGSMNEGQVRTKTMRITNKGKSDLRILRMDTDCSCAVINDMPKVIAPGETVVVEIKFDSIFKEGEQRKAITVYTNDPNNPKLNIIVTASVK